VAANFVRHVAELMKADGTSVRRDSSVAAA